MLNCYRCNSASCKCPDGQTVYVGDCRDVLRQLPAESVNCCVTSPPYWGLRDYGVDGQIGLEASMSEFLVAMLGVFREVHRVLRADGTLWLNLGDSYSGNVKGNGGYGTSRLTNGGAWQDEKPEPRVRASYRRDKLPTPRSDVAVDGLKTKGTYIPDSSR